LIIVQNVGGEMMVGSKFIGQEIEHCKNTMRLIKGLFLVMFGRGDDPAWYNSLEAAC